MGKTFAQLSMAEKNVVNHRGKAMTQFASEIDKVLVWLRQRLTEQKPPKPDHTHFENDDWSGHLKGR